MDRKNVAVLKLVCICSLVLLSLSACYPALQTSKKEEDNGFKFYSRAIEQHQAKNYTDALSYIDEAIKANNHIAVYYELRGDIFSGMDSLGNALLAYSDAKSRRSFYPEIFIKTGDIHYKRNDYDSAIRDFRKAIAQRPEQPVIFLSLVHCYLQQREYDVALNLLQEYNAQATKQKQRLHPDYYILLGKIHYENAKYDEVVFSVDIARNIKILSRNECIFYLRSLVELNRLEDAYSSAINFKDVMLESDSHFIRGLYYFRKSNFKDAKTQLEKSIQKKTKIYEAYQLLSEIYTQKGETDLAEKYLSSAVQYKSYRLINIDHKY